MIRNRIEFRNNGRKVKRGKKENNSLCKYSKIYTVKLCLFYIKYRKEKRKIEI